MFVILLHDAAAIVFTGNVSVDFLPTDPTVLLITGNAPVLVGPTGWQLYDMRWAYDSTTDTAYFGKRRGSRSGYRLIHMGASHAQRLW